MKYSAHTIFTTCILFLQCFFTASKCHAEAAKQEISWVTNYNQAVSLSQNSQGQKPLFLYFTGSDWCSWCFKFDEEILKSEDFIQLVGNKFIFTMIDFPIYKAQDTALRAQNEELKEKFHIHGFPTAIILDANQNEIARLNYRDGGGKPYAEHLLKILKEHEEFQKGLKTKKTQDAAALEKLYEQAMCRGMKEEATLVLQEGLLKEDNLFFLKTHYHCLVKSGKIHERAAKDVKIKLLAKDPQNQKHMHYDVAVLEFEAVSKNCTTSDIETALKPLVDYLARFGAQDQKHRWKIEMTISQTYRNHNQHNKALTYVKLAHAHAPSYQKVDIAKTIADLENSEAIVDAE